MSHEAREAARQQRLLQVLWRGAPDASLGDELAGPVQGQARGLVAYRANALAHARRALADGFPVLRALMDDEPFDAMAADYWLRCPPQRGDLAWSGERLPAFVEQQAALAEWPYLADVARLEWALQRAGSAPPPEQPPAGLDLLAEHDPAALRLVPAPALALVESRWPVGLIHAAHAPQADDQAFDRAREALAAGQSDAVLVWRDGFSPCCSRLDTPSAAWWRALFAGASLHSALRAAGDAFDFQAWFLDALKSRWLGAVRRVADAAVRTAPD